MGTFHLVLTSAQKFQHVIKTIILLFGFFKQTLDGLLVLELIPIGTSFTLIERIRIYK